MSKPLAIDLFCGLGGWAQGLLTENWNVIGFDNVRHIYGDHRYPAQLVVQDVRTLHGSQFKTADLIVASPPCQFFSYCAMPWTRAKALAKEVRADSVRMAKEMELFEACFRIQREACEAAGRHIPMVVENVRGAIPWVGRSRWNFGSFHLWGDVPALMPPIVKAVKVGGLDWNDRTRKGQAFNTHAEHLHKLPGFRFDGSGRSFQSASVEGVKISGENLSRHYDKETSSVWRTTGSKSSARKFASAMIAKIPEPLSRWIGSIYYPPREA
jgi:site-specific DNA-cytosine methylase